MVWYLIYSLGYTILAILPFAIIGIIGLFTQIEWIGWTGLFGGLAVFVVVIAYMRIRYQFISYAVLDYQGFRSKAIFKKAGTITNGSFWKLTLFAILSTLIAIIGVICIILGLIIAIPVIKIAQAKIYDTLKSHHE
jgi:uncharacterized membrane protein